MRALLRPASDALKLGIAPGKLERAAAGIDAWVDQGIVPGCSLLVARRGHIVLEHSVGVAVWEPVDRSASTSDDTVYFASSMAKPVVAMLILSLIESGQMLLDDRVGTLVPEFGRLGKERVTIRHLLLHTSGLPDMLPSNESLRKAHSPLASFVKAAHRCELDFTAGTRIQYSNIGYLLLGEVCQRLSGEPIATLAADRVLAPLGMSRSSFRPDPATYPSIATVRVPRRRAPVNWDINSDYWRQLSAPWAGFFATARDLASLAQFFLDACAPDASAWTEGHGEVLGPATARDMVRSHTVGLATVQGIAEAWGFGWNVRAPGTCAWAGDLGSRELFGHVGGSGCMVWADPASQLLCVVLTNQTTDWTADWRRFALLSNVVHSSIVK